MQMNALCTKQVSHVGSRDDHGQPIAGDDDQKCRRRVGSRSTGIQEPSCADIWTPGRRLWVEPGRQRPASVAVFAGNEWVPVVVISDVIVALVHRRTTTAMQSRQRCRGNAWLERTSRKTQSHLAMEADAKPINIGLAPQANIRTDAHWPADTEIYWSRGDAV